MAEPAGSSSSACPGEEAEEEEMEEGEEREEEFLPGYQTLQDYSKALLGEVVKATKAANSLPLEGDDFDFYSSFPGFRTFCSKMGSRVTRSISRLIRHQALPCYWPPAQALPTSTATPGEGAGLVASTEELDERMEAIIEANDVLLERVGVLMDEACGLRRREEPFVPAELHHGTAEVASWNRTKEPTGGGVASYNFMTSRNVPRPQVKFQDQVDNSNSPFVPRIRTKTNARQPLPEVYQRLQNPQSLNALISNSKEWALEKHKYMDAHPYRYELENLVPNDEQLLLSEPKVRSTVTASSAPGSLEEVPYTFINTVEQLDQLVAELSQCTEFAVDLENHSYRSFQGFVCLMQITTHSHDYLIDTLELRHHMHSLLDPFTNPRIVKVMHGADWDIPWLQRDFGLYVVNLFDTGQASRVLKLPKFSLAFLLQYCCGVQADKQYQLADWRIRPLPAEMVKYAREDTHYLLYIYDRMRNELIRRKTGGQNLLQTTLNLSRDVCLKTYQKPVFSADAYLKLYFKHKRNFNSQQLHCLRLLHEWRDHVAREEDESYGYVLPNHMLFQISEQLPREAQGVLACCTPIPTLLRQQLQEVFMFVHEARQTALTSELPTLAPPTPPPPPAPPIFTLTPSHSHPPTVPATHTEPSNEPQRRCHIVPRGPPAEPATPSLSAIEVRSTQLAEFNITHTIVQAEQVPQWAWPKMSGKVCQQLQQIEASFPDVLAQFMDARPVMETVTTATAATPAGSATPTPIVPNLTETASETVSRATGGAKTKSKQILSVREMGSKQRKISPPQVAREEVEEGEVEEGEEGGGEVKKMRLEDRFTPFNYQSASFTDYTHKQPEPAVVFQPRPSSGRDTRGGRGLRSKVHMRSGERSHTHTDRRQSSKPHLWPRKS